MPRCSSWHPLIIIEACIRLRIRNKKRWRFRCNEEGSPLTRMYRSRVFDLSDFGISVAWQSKLRVDGKIRLLRRRNDPCLLHNLSNVNETGAIFGFAFLHRTDTQENLRFTREVWSAWRNFFSMFKIFDSAHSFRVANYQCNLNVHVKKCQKMCCTCSYVFIPFDIM